MQYIPIEHVNRQVLIPTDTATYCPFKGDAGYYSVRVGGVTVDDAVWFYARPYPAVGEIAGHVAFYPNKADVTVTP